MTYTKESLDGHWGVSRRTALDGECSGGVLVATETTLLDDDGLKFSEAELLETIGDVGNTGASGSTLTDDTWSSAGAHLRSHVAWCVVWGTIAD